MGKKFQKIHMCKYYKKIQKKSQNIISVEQKMQILALTIITLVLFIGAQAIGIPLHSGTRCLIIQGQYDPIKLEVRFPVIPNREQNDRFRLSLIDYVEAENLLSADLAEKTVYRKNLNLAYNKIYQVCLEFVSERSIDPEKQKMYAEFRADQDFDALIGTFAVPPELVGEQNLLYIYNISESISRINKKVIENQQRQRQIQDGMAMSNLHKNERISMFTIIECTIIVLSGIYQVLALRRFLIQKNLY